MEMHRVRLRLIKQPQPNTLNTPEEKSQNIFWQMVDTYQGIELLIGIKFFLSKSWTAEMTFDYINF